jgi:hypothetical protein
VLAVGHSYGGAMITNAATNANNVVGPVYVAAFVRDEGETLADIESDSKESVLKTLLMQLQYPSGQGEETAVEFAILESKLPVCTEVPRRGILRTSLSAMRALDCAPFREYAANVTQREDAA